MLQSIQQDKAGTSRVWQPGLVIPRLATNSPEGV